MSRRAGSGFTLVELLIVTVIMAVISLAIYSALRNGLAIWSRLSRTDSREDVNIFLYRFSNDLSNSFSFGESSVQGLEEECAFWGLVRGAQAAERSVGMLTYRYDPSGKRLLRLEQDYSSVYRGDEHQESAALEGVGQAQFLYYTWDEQSKEYLWLDTWEDSRLPLAVRLEFDFEDEGKNVHYTRSVFLPAAS